MDTLEELENASGEDEAEEPEDDVVYASDDDLDLAAEEADEDVVGELLGIPGVNEIDDNSVEPLEEVCKNCAA